MAIRESQAGTSLRPSRRELFDRAVRPKPPPAHYADVSLREGIPLRSSRSRSSSPPRARSLEEFRRTEGEATRRDRLLILFNTLKPPSEPTDEDKGSTPSLPMYENIRQSEHEAAYERELWAICGGSSAEDQSRQGPNWERFLVYADLKEIELWETFVNLDKNNDMLIDKTELESALDRSNIEISNDVLTELFGAIDTDKDDLISFTEFRDFLLLLPRNPSMSEILRFYHVSRSKSRPGTTQLNADLDVIMHEKPPPHKKAKHVHSAAEENEPTNENGTMVDVEEVQADDQDEAEKYGVFDGAGKFLLAGGLAGAISRTATAPLDRLKIHLITMTEVPSLPQLEASASPFKMASNLTNISRHGFGALSKASQTLYMQGGAKTFFVGNGMNVVKIFPESAIKFLSFESSKRFFARYMDKTENMDELSGKSRFVSGGIAGITSQTSIYWLETLKTRVMSSTGGEFSGNRLILFTAKEMWSEGGLAAYHRGLWWGLIGVFPYSAIDMSLYEFIKSKYVRWSHREEPGVMASLTFGALSGGIGATSVYPLNLLRTRLQAQGTPAHPQKYGNWKDVIVKTYSREGMRGFYKGLGVSLLKVIPSMSISWATYEAAKSVMFEKEEES